MATSRGTSTDQVYLKTIRDWIPWIAFTEPVKSSKFG
jgi:hypothetical protein